MNNKWWSMGRILPVFTVYVLLVTMVTGYKHVVFMHGILDGAESLSQFQSYVEQYHPGTPTTNIDMYDNLQSIKDMWSQVDRIADEYKTLLTNTTSEGTLLICYSQGGLICRGLLSVLEHNVDTFIALSCPLAGQFGDTQYLKYLFPKYLRDNIYKLFYTEAGQQISIGNYWYDPHHQELYGKTSAFLGKINNQTSMPNPDLHGWKSNFSRLKNLVLIGGPDDGVITPWQSSQFGMYDENLNVKPYTQQPWYLTDAFGLKTLDAMKRIHVYTVPGVQHQHWHTNRTVFESYIKPWLT